MVMKNNLKPTKIWDPMEVFRCLPNRKFAVVILDRPILLNKGLILPMWKRAEITVTVDGGTNRWLDYLGNLKDDIFNKKSSEYTPKLVTGDFDSILPETLEKLSNLGVNIIQTSDQSRTDYSKALIQLAAECKRRNIALNSVYTLVESSGRMDHIMGIINTLFLSHQLISDVDVLINVASNSLTWLLQPGDHIIKIPEILRQNNAWVGLIPISSDATCVTTTGLKWNLDRGTLAFGKLVSTSNTYDGSPEVTVSTTTPLIWTMGIEALVEDISPLISL